MTSQILSVDSSVCFDISDNDIVQFSIYCENVEIFCQCLSKLFSMGYYWWGDRTQNIKRNNYDKYIICYSGDLDIPKNIVTGDINDDYHDITIINGAVWLRKDKLDAIESRQ